MTPLEHLQEIAQRRDDKGRFSDFERLWDQFALWTRTGSDIPHYTTPLGSRYISDRARDEPRKVLTLSDDEAMYLNRVICYVKPFHRLGYAIFSAVYIQGRDLQFLDRDFLIRRQLRAKHIKYTLDIGRLILQDFIERLRRKLLAHREGDF